MSPISPSTLCLAEGLTDSLCSSQSAIAHPDHGETLDLSTSGETYTIKGYACALSVQTRCSQRRLTTSAARAQTLEADAE